MFADHQPIISKYARQNPENFGRVLKFVVLTIRTRFYNVPADMESLENARTAEELSGILYGWKTDSISQIESEKESLYCLAEEIYFHATSERIAAENLLSLFAGIKGLGLAKSGFVCSLVYGLSACLDSHNLERFGIDPESIRSSRYKGAKTYATRAKYIALYCDLVEKCGTSESLWDTWCNYLFLRPDETGLKMNNNRPAYKSADHVSALHCEALGLTY